MRPGRGCPPNAPPSTPPTGGAPTAELPAPKPPPPSKPPRSLLPANGAGTAAAGAGAPGSSENAAAGATAAGCALVSTSCLKLGGAGAGAEDWAGSSSWNSSSTQISSLAGAAGAYCPGAACGACRQRAMREKKSDLISLVTMHLLPQSSSTVVSAKQQRQPAESNNGHDRQIDSHLPCCMCHIHPRSPLLDLPHQPSLLRNND